jgi:NAD(P)-dependent dehydrogenase (short-subunit alcohol dehydrogenase family)
MTKSNYAGHTVFISGASEGVGRATAISFAKASATEFALSAQSDISSLESEIQSTAKNAGKKSPQVLKLKLDVTDQTFVEPQQRLPRKSSGSWIF